MFDYQVNYFAVLVAAISSMIVGFLWYGPLFGKMWMQLIGKKEEDLPKGNLAVTYGLSYVLAAVTAYVLAHFVFYTNAATWVDGLITGLWIGIGFVATTVFINGLYENRPVKLSALYIGYQLVTLMFMGAILAWWPY